MEAWLGYLGTGAFVGVCAGMLGIGGGAIIVPLLVWLFERHGLPREHIVHLAIGSGMATIIFTSVSTVYAHARRGAVRWDIVKRMTPGVLVGGLAGAWLAKSISSFGLALFFAVLIYANATNMLIDRKPKPSRQLPGTAGLSGATFVISLLSSLAAIGGAALSIPFMVLCNVPMLHALGTAAAIGFPIALAGTIGYIFTGLHVAGLPAGTLGYVYLPAVIGVSVASVLTAPLGARIAHSLPTKRLKQVFAVLLYILATRMLVTLY